MNITDEGCSCYVENVCFEGRVGGQRCNRRDSVGGLGTNRPG
jgi:hypothetical protein